jgi:hypothetical protein
VATFILQVPGTAAGRHVRYRPLHLMNGLQMDPDRQEELDERFG